jgi:hypothetical protein
MLAALNRFGPLRCMVGRLSADAAVSSAQLTFVTFLGQFRIEFGSLSSRANEVHLTLLLCQNNDGSGVDARDSVPYPMTQTKLQYIPSSCQKAQAETNSARGHGAALFASSRTSSRARPSDSCIRSLALCNCDFEFPTEQSRISVIS